MSEEAERASNALKKFITGGSKKPVAQPQERTPQSLVVELSTDKEHKEKIQFTKIPADAFIGYETSPEAGFNGAAAVNIFDALHAQQIDAKLSTLRDKSYKVRIPNSGDNIAKFLKLSAEQAKTNDKVAETDGMAR